MADITRKKSRKVFSELLPEYTVRAVAGISILIIVAIFVFISLKAWPTLKASGIGLITGTNFDRQIGVALKATPEHPVYNFGLGGLIIGTLLSTGCALMFAAVLGIGGAVVIAEFLPAGLAGACRAIVRLLASIPSVVFGLLGTIAVVPLFRSLITTPMTDRYHGQFQLTGDGFGASVVVLLFMIVPTVISLSLDAIEAVPYHFKETGFAFGMSHFRVIWKIILPIARSGITASVILAAGRGIGEAIAVSMVCGSLGFIPNPLNGMAALLTPVLPLASAIVNKSETMGIPYTDSALFSCALLLLCMGALLSISASAVERRMRKAAGYEQ